MRGNGEGSLARSTILVSLGGAASRILGFLRDILLAGALGAGPAADAFLVAYRIPNLVRRVLTEGGFNAAFAPLYLRLRAEQGGAAASRFAGEALAGFAVLVLGLVGIVELFAGPVVLALAAGYADDAATMALARDAARLAFPFVAFAGFAGLLSALLNAERRFLAAALAPLAVNLLMIAGLLLLTRAGGDPEQIALALAALVSLSGAAHLAIVAAAARRLPFRLSLTRPRWSAPLRHLARVAGPALLASGAAQFIILAGAEAASFQNAAVSWFYFAERVFQLPLGFVGAAAGIVLLPELARAARDDAALSAQQNRALAAGLLVALPAGAALFVLAGPIVALLFERGAFEPRDTAGTAAMLAWLGVGLPLAAAGRILSQAFFARGDLRSVVLASLAGMALTFAAGFILAPRFGPAGIAGGVALGFGLHAAALAGVLLRRGWWRIDRSLLRPAAGAAVAAAAMAAFLQIAVGHATPVLAAGEGDTRRALALAALCLGGALVYAAACFALRAVTREDLARWRRG